MNTARKYEAEQAQQLQAWVEGRKRNRRVQIPYWQESGYEAESDKLEKAMDRVGWSVLVVAGVLMLAIIVIQLGMRYGW